jgi:hypothetical protein
VSSTANSTPTAVNDRSERNATTATTSVALTVDQNFLRRSRSRRARRRAATWVSTSSYERS